MRCGSASAIRWIRSMDGCVRSVENFRYNPASHCGMCSASRIMVVRVPKVRIRFLTSTPLDIRRGSGTYVGIHVLATRARTLGPRRRIRNPARPAARVHLRAPAGSTGGCVPSPEFDLTVGFDMDGYRIARSPSHVASLKGVIADEVRFESRPDAPHHVRAGALRAAARAARGPRPGDQPLFRRTRAGILRAARVARPSCLS